MLYSSWRSATKSTERKGIRLDLCQRSGCAKGVRARREVRQVSPRCFMMCESNEGEYERGMRVEGVGRV